VFEVGDTGRKSFLPRAVVPKIRLESSKITRGLTTEWFAKRVDSAIATASAASQLSL
jgi:hypothetical protein